MTDLIPAHLSWLRAGGASQRTVLDREGVLHRANRALPLGLEIVQEEDIARWLANPRWADATRNVYWRHLFGFYSWAERRHLDHNPMAGMPCPPAPAGEPRPVPDEVLLFIVEHAANPYWLCAILAASAGLRCLEMAALLREDITEQRIYLTVAKGGRRASVPTAPEVWEAVRHFPAGSLMEHVGARPDPRWVSIRSAVYFRRVLKLPGVSLHRLRHTFASRLRTVGADAFVIKRALRHQSLRSTERYVGASEEECGQAIRSLPLLHQRAN